jgi:type IV fimbrial biogenesis protein FimT
VQFVLGANSAWTVGCVTPVGDVDGDGKDDCPAEIQSRSAGEGSSAQITVLAASDTVVFNNLGTVNAIPAPFTQVDIDSSISTEDRPLRVTIGVGGNTRMCDPATTLAASDPRKC